MIDTRIETKHIIAELSVTEKVCLYNALYKDLASKGIGGDTELAHVNMAEMAVLRTMGGAGTLNPDTGLIQFMGGGGGSPPPPPTNTTQSQTSEFPAELKPYIKDVLSKSQAIQEKRESEGYIPYEGPQIAEFTPEQEQAFTGIQGMVGQGQTYFDPSAQLAASSARAPTDQEISGYMSPYMQQVVDIQKREAERQGDVSQQQLATQAVGAGGFGGSRMAILEAEQNRNLQTQLGDIQARGTAAAYEDAQARLAAQRQRELAGSAQFMNLGTTAPQQQLKELTAVEAIGAQKQAQSQQALNIAKDAFGREQTFPEQTLQQYQSVIRGFPLDANLSRQTQTVTPAPSYLQQAAGLGGLGLGVAGAFGAFRNSGGLVSRMHGGQVDQNSGLGSIVVKREAGRRVGSNGTGVILDLAPRPSPRPSPDNILNETDEKRVERVIGRPDPKTFEEEFPQFKDGEGSRFWRGIGSGTSAVRDIIGEVSTMYGRDITSLGEYLFGKKGKTPLSLAQIRVVQEVEGNRKDLAQTGVVRESAKKIIENAEREGIELSPSLLAKSLALDLRPASEVGEEAAARDAQMFPQPESDLARMAAQSKRPPDRVLSDDPRMVASSKQDDYGVGVSGEGGDPLAVARNKLLRQQGEFGTSGSTTPNVETSPAPAVASTAPAVASTAPAVASTAPAVASTALDDRIREQGVDDAPYPEGYDAQFADKLDKATTASQYSTSRLPDVMKETREELFKAQQKRATEKGAELEKRRTGLDNDRWLALANLGTSILAQPGGQTFLQALGKGAKDSNIIGTLSKLNREDADLASKIKDIPVELLVSKFKLKKDEAQHVKDATNFELKIAELEAAKIAATSKAQKDQFDKMIKALNLNIRARTLDFTLKGGKSSLTKQENEYLDDFIKTKRNEIEELSPNTYGWWNIWDADKGKQNRENMKQAFKDYARRNKPTDINSNWDNFAKRYK
jgi:hypothetical protein